MLSAVFGAVATVSLMGTALVLAWVAIVLLTLAVAGLMRQVHLLPDRAGG